MVNEVVPLENLNSRVMEIARQIARMDPWAVRLAKRSVNAAMDTMGFSHSIQTNFDIHHLGHLAGRSPRRRGRPLSWRIWRI